MQSTVLSSMSLHDCHSIYVEALLSSCDVDTIDLARELIVTSGADATGHYLRADEAEHVCRTSLSSIGQIAFP